MQQALNAFQTLHNIEKVDVDVYAHNEHDDRKLYAERPWKHNPQYFTKARISAIALVKMAIHARSGGDLEVMGLMQGRVVGDTMVVLDAFALPVEGSETRVTAGAEALEYAVQLVEDKARIGRLENVIGWYHSHPGYGCWLSGIDVTTQANNQQYQDPFLAVVIDPHRSMLQGKIDIGAFRTLPPGHTAAAPSEAQPALPLSKVADFGAHANKYYALPVTLFKSALDEQLLQILWEKYWISTLAESPQLAGRELVAQQVGDLCANLDAQRGAVLERRPMLAAYGLPDRAGGGRGRAAAASRVPRDSPVSIRSAPGHLASAAASPAASPVLPSAASRPAASASAVAPGPLSGHVVAARQILGECSVHVAADLIKALLFEHCGQSCRR